MLEPNSMLSSQAFAALTAIALTGATCLDRSAREIPECVLIISPGHATFHASSSKTLPPVDRTIDLRGRWIIPGFIDNHVHLGHVKADSAIWIRAGVTSVVDNGDNLSPVELAARYAAGPHVDACGPIITRTHGYPALGASDAPALEVSGKDDAARATKELIERLHPACIKIAVERGFLADVADKGWPMLEAGEIEAIVREAHASGLLVRAHVTQRGEFDLAVRSGVDVIAHAPIQRLPDALLKRAARAGVVMVSTVALWHGNERTIAVSNVVRYAAMGGPIAIGSDYPNWKDAGLPGTELALLNAGGLTPEQLLVALTRETVHPSREQRDFVVLRSDPRASIEAFRDIDLVIRDGLIAFSRSEALPAQTPPSLADELNAMADEDQSIRRRFIQDQSNRTLDQEMTAMDRTHVARLREIINQHGWPTFTMVGTKAANNAWLIAQHGGKEFLDEVLPLMKTAMEKGEMLGAYYVRSVDRARIQNGLKQVYGSQFDTDDGRCAVMPIEDREHVDERRKVAGLEPLADYARQYCGMFKREPNIDP